MTSFVEVEETIGGEADAELALEQLAEQEATARRVNDQHALMVARYDEWADSQLKLIEGRTEALRDRLHRWMQARLEADPKAAKTVSLPSGTVAVRKGTSSVEVDDAEAFIAWADANGYPQLVRRPEPVTPAPSVDKRAVKAALASLPDVGGLYDPATGDTAPGVRMVRHDDTLQVHLDLEDSNLDGEVGL